MYYHAVRLGMSSDEIDASVAAQARAERDAFQKFLRDCEGIRLLRSLTREGMNSIDQWALLTRRLKEMPKIFARRQTLTQLVQSLRAQQISLADFSQQTNGLFNDCKACSPKICALKRRLEQGFQGRQIEPAEFSRQIASLLHECILQEYKFPSGYAFGSEQEETARARCALSEFKWRDYGPSPKHLSRNECETILGRLCALKARLSAVRRDAQNKKEQIDSQRGRLDRLRCERWPSDVRPPADHARWCAEIKSKILQFEQELSQLTATAATLDDQLFSMARDYAAGCEDFPGCLVGLR